MSTSKLQRKTSEFLSTFFGAYTVRENIRPHWLITPQGERLELDFLIEELDIAIEVQGKQHFYFIPFFHQNHTGFKKRLIWDRFKRQQCRQRGVALIEIASESDIVLQLESLIPDKRQVELVELPLGPPIILPDLQIPIEESWQRLLVVRQETSEDFNSSDPKRQLDAINRRIVATEELAKSANGVKPKFVKRRRAIRKDLPNLYKRRNRLEKK